MALDIKKIRTETLEQDIKTYTRLVTEYGIQSETAKNHLRQLKEELARRTKQD